MVVPEVQDNQEIVTQVQQQAQDAFHHSMLSLQNWIAIAAALGIILLIGLALRRQAGREKVADLEEGTVDQHPLPKLSNPFGWDALRERFNLPSKQTFSAVRIRWIYAALCSYGKVLGIPRKPASTPLEYRSQLYTVFSNFQTDIDEITAAYIAVRYGSIPEDPDEIKRLNQSWERLEKEARSRIQQKTKGKLRRKKN